MTRIPFVALVVAVPLGAAAAALSQQPRFTAATHTVSLYVTATDGTGRLASDLTKSDFQVFDNGAPQTLTVFARELQPITVVLMLDRSGSVEPQFPLVRDAAQVFIEQLLDGDRARVGNFSDRIEIQPSGFTSDRGELTRILHGDLQKAGLTPLWNATSAAMTALAHEPGRRVVLLFTDGANSPGLDGPNISFAEVRDRSRAEDVMIYGIGLFQTCDAPAVRPEGAMPRPVYQRRGAPGGGGGGSGPLWPGPRGPVGPPRGAPPIGGGGRVPIPGRGGPFSRGPGGESGCSEEAPDPGLKQLAMDSGGGYFELRHPPDLDAAFARVADELHRQYVLGFNASVLDGETHMLEVRVNRPNISVRARKSYLAR